MRTSRESGMCDHNRQNGIFVSPLIYFILSIDRIRLQTFLKPRQLVAGVVEEGELTTEVHRDMPKYH